MNQNDVGPSGAKSVGGASTAVAGVVVGNQEDAARQPIKLPTHDLADEAHVFVLNIDRPPWCGRQRAMFALPGLDAGFLIDAEHVIARPRRCTFPAVSIQQDPPMRVCKALFATHSGTHLE